MKILMLSYYLPPVGGSGVVRITKFAKYLKRFNITPIILTVKDIAYYSYDESLLKDLAGIQIFKSESLDLARVLYLLGKRKTSYAGSYYSRLLNYLSFPDAKIGLLPFAFWQGKRIIESEKPSFLFATSPPFSILLLGLLLKERFNLPLISDFRDPYPTGTAPPPFLLKKPLRIFLDLVLKKSDKVIVVNSGTKRILDYPAIVISNGFDPEDFSVAAKSLPKRGILYAGSLLENEKELLSFASQVEDIPDFKVYLAGKVERSFLKKISFRKNIIYLGILPRKETISLMKGADYLLYITKPHQFVGLKLYEYIGAQRPIIFYGKLSKDIEELNQEFNIGYYYSAEIKEKIRKNEALKINPNLQANFSFSHLTAKLVSVIN